MIKKYISDLKKEFSGYSGATLAKDAMAGLTVAAVALPLALAFGVSSGADAQAGLITAIFAGLIMGVLSGASYQISGPTGAMAAILMGISAAYGIEGVLIAGFLSGVILLLAGIFKLGNLVSFIPAPVITGFTSGIAITIALGQIDNFFGTASVGENAIEKLLSYSELGFPIDLATLLFGALVVVIMLLYPKKLNAVIPSSLMGIIIALIVNIIMNPSPVITEVGTIPSSLVSKHGLLTAGFDFSKISALISPAISIAALGMIESLLCGASAGKMKGEKMDARRELIAQGIGNIVIPLFGGVPATSAIARTSVAIKSGGVTRLVSVFHSVTLLLAMFLLGPVMSRIPLAALAGVLMVTAWRMNEWHEIKHIFKNKLYFSILQFLVTMIATVVFDLTIAIIIGVLLAMLVFVVKNTELYLKISDVDNKKLEGKGINISDSIKVRVVYLAGPLFFGTQDKVINALCEMPEDTNTIILSMRGVPYVDDSAVTELEAVAKECSDKNIRLIITGLQAKVEKHLTDCGFISSFGNENIYWDAVEAFRSLSDNN